MENFGFGNLTNVFKKASNEFRDIESNIVKKLEGSKEMSEEDKKKAEKANEIKNFNNQYGNVFSKPAMMKYNDILDVNGTIEKQQNLYQIQNSGNEVCKDSVSTEDTKYVCSEYGDSYKFNLTTGNDYDTVKNISSIDNLEDCLKACSTNACSAASYDSNTKKCYMKSGANNESNRVNYWKKELINEQRKLNQNVEDFIDCDGDTRPVGCDVNSESADCVFYATVCNSDENILKNINQWSTGDSSIINSLQNIQKVNSKMDKINNQNLENNEDIKRQIGISTNELLKEQKKYELKNRVVKILRNIIIVLIIIFIFMICYHYFNLSKYTDKISNTISNIKKNGFSFNNSNNNNNNNNYNNNNNNYNKNRNNNNIKKLGNKHGLF